MMLNRKICLLMLSNLIFCGTFNEVKQDFSEQNKKLKELDLRFKEAMPQYTQRPEEMDTPEYKKKLLNKLLINFLKLDFSDMALKKKISETEENDSQDILFVDVLEGLKQYETHTNGDFYKLYEDYTFSKEETEFNMKNKEEAILSIIVYIYTDLFLNNKAIQENELFDAFTLASKFINYRSLNELYESTDQVFYVPVIRRGEIEYCGVSGERYICVLLINLLEE